MATSSRSCLRVHGDDDVLHRDDDGGGGVCHRGSDDGGGGDGVPRVLHALRVHGNILHVLTLCLL